MNSSKTDNILQKIQSNSLNITSINSELQSSNAKLNNIDSALVDIGTTLAPQKVIFSGYLTDGTNEYLPRSDYTSTPLIFYWQNPYDKPVYIQRYNFRYQEAQESSTLDDLYHSPAFTTKIGLVNDTGDDFDSNYITYKQNLEMIDFTTSSKRTYTSSNYYVYDYIFPENNGTVIEIGVSKKFGHLIASDFQAGQGYDNDPLGIVYGYYYK